jgi:putative membrane protein insertion efficiency factor
MQPNPNNPEPEASGAASESVRNRIVGALHSLYKRWLSPVLHGLLHAGAPLAGGCRFQPTCSEYAAVAIARHGWLRGGWWALWRLLRCNPFTPARRTGWDPVPERGQTRRTQNHLR